MLACKNSGFTILDCFADFSKTISMPISLDDLMQVSQTVY